MWIYTEKQKTMMRLRPWWITYLKQIVLFIIKHEPRSTRILFNYLSLCAMENQSVILLLSGLSIHSPFIIYKCQYLPFLLNLTNASIFLLKVAFYLFRLWHVVVQWQYLCFTFAILNPLLTGSIFAWNYMIYFLHIWKVQILV